MTPAIPTLTDVVKRSRYHPATQCDQILHLLKCGRRLTPLAALKLVGCFRLAARIADLRDRGYQIKTARKHLPDGKVVAEYWL